MHLLGASGVLIEVGAHEGVPAFHKFAAAGWTIHAFEPDPDNRDRLERSTRSRPNVTVVPKAVGDKSDTMTLYRSAESSGISSLLPFTPRHEPAIEVEVVALRDYLADAGITRVDFLKMDVEGYERFVLDGFPWDTHHPRMVMLEFEDRKTMQIGYTWRDLADELQRHEYRVLISEWHPIARYGIAHRWRRFAAYPAELADGRRGATCWRSSRLSSGG